MQSIEKNQFDKATDVIRAINHDLSGDITALKLKINRIQRELTETKDALANILFIGKSHNLIADKPLADYSAVLEALTTAGPDGIGASALRNLSRPMRRTIESGILLPPELARAGVTLKRIGKGWRYYAPTF